MRAFILQSCACVFGLRWGDFVAAALLAEDGFKGRITPVSMNMALLDKELRKSEVRGGCARLVFIGAPPPKASWLTNKCNEALALGIDDNRQGLAILLRGGNVFSFYRLGEAPAGSATVVSKILGVDIPARIESFTRAIESAISILPPPRSLVGDVRFAGLAAVGQSLEWRMRASEGIAGVEEVLRTLVKVGEKVLRGGLNTVRIEDKFRIPKLRSRRFGEGLVYVVVGDDSAKIVVDGLVARPVRYSMAAVSAELIRSGDVAYIIILLEENELVKSMLIIAGPLAKCSPRRVASLVEAAIRSSKRKPPKRFCRLLHILTRPNHPSTLHVGLPLNATLKLIREVFTGL